GAAGDGLPDGGDAAEHERARARTAIRRLAATVALAVGPRSSWRRRAARALAAPSLADAVAAALGVTDRQAIERALTVCADHELNPSAFAARVAAGTGADLYGILGAALATWSGPRHGGAPDHLEGLLRDDLAGVRRAVAQQRSYADGIPGFGHPLYPGGDPRAELLLAEAARVGADRPRWTAFAAIVADLTASGCPAPNLDAGLVGLAAALELPAGTASAVFAIGRAVGWLAHGWEQRATGRLVRPRALYTGA
ncbi:MAG: citrate/2-methylcitrate synthase, partial [Myxococcota bacterium]